MEEIKAGELMIGNYIRDIWSENGFFKVTETRKDKVFYGNCFKAKYKDLRPIPLTEDILLKAGFEKVDEFTYSINNIYLEERAGGVYKVSSVASDYITII